MICAALLREGIRLACLVRSNHSCMVSRSANGTSRTFVVFDTLSAYKHRPHPSTTFSPVRHERYTASTNSSA
jgi:hypothetical protein